MLGHSRAEQRRRVEDLDEYEEDGEDQEEEAEEDYEEEKDPKPSKEELEYLELRQRLKEAVRKQMKKDYGSVLSQSQEKKKLPYDNYGSFFGPSQPVIAQRVLQESKSILQTQHLSSKFSNPPHDNKKSPASTTAGTKPGIRDQPPKFDNELKTKVQTLKVTRDYSFLLSDDAELPAPAKEPPSRKFSVPDSDARSARFQSSKSKMSMPSRQVRNGREERKPVSMNCQSQPKAGLHKLAAASRPSLASADSRKKLGSYTANGPGRPAGIKGLPSKTPVATVDKRISAVGAKNSVPGMHKASLSKLHSSVPKQHLEQKKEFREPNKAKVMPKQPSSKPQFKPPKQNPVRATMQEHHPKKKPLRRYSDEDDDVEGEKAISLIRRMFGYNPNKFAELDDDCSDMEANFDDIQEEEWKSAKIAREEDERELRLIEEEEKRERLRKEAKKRKLSQR